MADYDKPRERYCQLYGFSRFCQKPLTIEFVHEDGSKDIIIANHTYNEGKLVGSLQVHIEFNCSWKSIILSFEYKKRPCEK
jgi:hypothetical protein